MLGDKILVAPVIKKGQTTQNVYLPDGEWEAFDGKIIKGGKQITVDAPIDVLPFFVKIN